MGERPLDKRRVREVLAALEDELEGAEPREIVIEAEHSNELAKARFGDGRTLMVKRARRTGAAKRFQTSRLAAELLLAEMGVVAPEYLDVPGDLDGGKLLVYWRIPGPTLDEVWPSLGDEERADVLRDWGALVRRIHRVRLPGHGSLLEARRSPSPPGEALRFDLEERMRESAAGIWPAGVRVMDRLARAIPGVEERADNTAVLVHNDLFSANVLCETDGALRCVGVLDLEDAFAGPPEADLAKTEVLHGPLFSHFWRGPWFERLLEGAGYADRFLLAFFRACHLLNMGLHAAASGMEAHAGRVARAADAEVDALGSGRRHRAVVDAA